MRLPVILLPWNISMFIKGNISLKRLRDFLLKEEICEDYFDTNERQNNEENQVKINDLDFGWDCGETILKKYEKY